jgi:hypothetical protein
VTDSELDVFEAPSFLARLATGLRFFLAATIFLASDIDVAPPHSLSVRETQN